MSNDKSLDPLKKPTASDFFILDIDSTLVTTHQRNQAILEDWVKQHGHQFPQESQLLKLAQCQFGDYGLHDALRRVKFEESILGSRQHLDDFWRQHFFSNNYLHQDVATRGAVHWVQNLEEWGVDFVYLTARHKTQMWEGTLSSLNELGFPINENILFLKEDLNDSDEIYKSKTMHKLISQYTDKKLWLIDNEPLVLHQISEDHPQVNLVWFESTHSGKKQPPTGIARITDFSFALEN